MKTLNEILDQTLIMNTSLTEAVSQPEMVKTFKVLEDIHKKLFPKSWQAVTDKEQGLNIPSTMIIFRSTITDKWGQGHKENDPHDAIFTIQYLGDEKYQAVLAKGKYLMTRKSYTANKTPFRKVTGDAQTVIKKITEWENNRKAIYDKNIDDIPK